MGLSYDKRAAMASKHALMTTTWTCWKCAKRNTLMLMKPEDWDRDNNVMCSNCKKMSQVRHRQKTTLRTTLMV